MKTSPKVRKSVYQITSNQKRQTCLTALGLKTYGSLTGRQARNNKQ